MEKKGSDGMSFDDAPPIEWEECGCCGGYHPPGYTAECRDDRYRWSSEECIQLLKEGKL